MPDSRKTTEDHDSVQAADAAEFGVSSSAALEGLTLTRDGAPDARLWNAYGYWYLRSYDPATGRTLNAYCGAAKPAPGKVSGLSAPGIRRGLDSLGRQLARGGPMKMCPTCGRKVPNPPRR